MTEIVTSGLTGYTTALWIAAIIFAAGVVGSIVYDIESRKRTASLTTLHVITIGCALMIYTLYRPITYYELGCANLWEWARGVLATVHNTLSTFILDCDFGEMVKNLSSLDSEKLRFWYSLAMGTAYVLAPVLTFANVLVLFKNVIHEHLANKGRCKRPVYIMSELNEMSASLAESIYEKHRSTKKWYARLFVRPLFIFSDVFGHTEENGYELVLRARKIRAVMVRKDVSHIKLKNKKNRVEIFLIGEDESENVSQAICLTKALKNKTNVAIFVYASSESSGRIIDSLDKGGLLLGNAVSQVIENDASGVLRGDYDELFRSNGIGTDDTFYLKRIDPVDMLVTDMFSNEKNGIAVKIMERAAKSGIISIAIVGLGLYGRQILKTATWFFQKMGYKLEINVFEDNTASYERICQECPEFVSVNPSDRIGDANYDIRFFTGVNCFSSSFDACFEGEDKEHLERTQAVFVTLGNDDMNIEASIMIRKLFDRVKGIDEKTLKRAKKDASLDDADPFIYAVVYDDKKYEMLGSANGGNFGNHKEQDYRIDFVGSLSKQYSYDTIERMLETENRAIAYHLEWARLEAKLREFYENDQVFKAHYDDCGGSTKWSDSYLFYSEHDDDAEKNPSLIGTVKPGEVRSSIEQFFKFEYFRNASMAKALHKKVMNPKPEGHTLICECKECDACRITEHMRWNAYMRSIGYIYGPVRNDRAKVHHDLVLWDELTLSERYKD